MILVFLTGYSKSDDTGRAAPAVSYDQELIASFFTNDSSSAPVVHWNGDIGRFGLKNAVKNVSIAPITGVISRNKILPLGDHVITVISYNNAGTTTLDLNLENRFEGKFEGVYQVNDEDRLVEVIFENDGTGVLSYNGSDPIDGEYTYLKNKIQNRNETEEKFHILRCSLDYDQKGLNKWGNWYWVD